MGIKFEKKDDASAGDANTPPWDADDGSKVVFTPPSGQDALPLDGLTIQQDDGEVFAKDTSSSSNPLMNGAISALVPEDGGYNFYQSLILPEGVKLTSEQEAELQQQLYKLSLMVFKGVIEGTSFKLNSKDSVAVVSKKAEHQSEQSFVTEKIGTTLAHEPMCNIGFNAGQTVGLPKFSNIKFGVSLNVPCFATELDETYAFVKSWVDEKMSELQDEINSAKSSD